MSLSEFNNVNNPINTRELINLASNNSNYRKYR